MTMQFLNDIPFCDERKEYFERRCERGIKIGKLRKFASILLGKTEENLTKEDLHQTEEILFSKRLPLAFGKVNQVTVTKDMVLMPLSPLDHRSTHFFTTIIYDLWQLGYEKKDMKFYFKDFLTDNSLITIIDYVRRNGRIIWKDVSKPFQKEVIILKC